MKRYQGIHKRGCRGSGPAFKWFQMLWMCGICDLGTNAYESDCRWEWGWRYYWECYLEKSRPKRKEMPPAGSYWTSNCNTNVLFLVSILSIYHALSCHHMLSLNDPYIKIHESVIEKSLALTWFSCHTSLTNCNLGSTDTDPGHGYGKTRGNGNSKKRRTRTRLGHGTMIFISF